MSIDNGKGDEMHTHKQITVNGKIYGYFVDASGKLVNVGYGVAIRSESNPNKTPYLKNPNSSTYRAVLAEIEAREGGAA